MDPFRYFMPGMRFGPVIRTMPINYYNPRGISLFSRAINGIKGVNWSGLLTGANKTLNVVNQTIPLIRQAKPMVNNVRSILHLAKAFGKETKKNNYTNNGVNLMVKDYNHTRNKKQINSTDNIYGGSPTFFV